MQEFLDVFPSHGVRWVWKGSDFVTGEAEEVKLEGKNVLAIINGQQSI